MAMPVLWTIDDDPDVLQAVRNDLRQYVSTAAKASGTPPQYRVMAASSGASALDALKQLKARNEPVALFLVDQRMPEMTGVEFLEEARKLYPEARRVLLTAYSDSDAAIRAINSVRVDYYLVKPWSPAQENLYPILNRLLAAWQEDYRPDFNGIRVIGNRWSPLTHDIKDFLARNRQPYLWLDVETDPRACEQLLSLNIGASVEEEQLPVVLFSDGSYLARPTIAEIAGRIGLQTEAKEAFYDLVIVGAGPAGLAAAVYGASEGLRTLLIEREAPGGQAGTSSLIENYLGFPQGVSGMQLANLAVEQAEKFHTEILRQEVVGLRVEDPYRIVKLKDGSEVSAYAVVIATGVTWRKLNVPGLGPLTGAGVYYGAAITEAMACRDERVFIVGGANSAGQGAMYFSRYARHVTMLVRGDSLARTMSQYLIEQIEKTPNIEVRTCTQVVAAHGDKRLEAIDILDAKADRVETVPATSLFIFIGAEPCTEWLKDVVERDDHGFLLSGPDLIRDGKRPATWKLDRDPMLLETSVPGVMVAGDVRRGSVKRCAAGVGAGSIAVQFVHQYLAEVRG